MKLPYNPDFSGKVAVVTGGAGVLCAMFVKALSFCGARVAILDLALDKAEELANEIRANGGEAIAIRTNVLEQQSVAEAHARVLAEFGPCDILVNGAGGNNAKATTDDEFFDRATSFADGKKSFFDLEPSGFDFVFGLNLKGTLLPTQAFARDMAEREKGVILNISSMNAFTPLTKIPAYSAAKAAVSNFTRWLAVYFSQSGIRVNAVAPGFFSTQQNAKLLWNADGTPTPRTQKILNSTPLKRFGEAEELLGALLFLLDENASSFVTGSVLTVDGGFSAYSGV